MKGARCDSTAPPPPLLGRHLTSKADPGGVG